ncbi:hypothetical protein [Aeromicrobium sp.]|uniref:hypothetical protein n=1 Tax=Aeromicrobium sp. TaxID=1871063 RepID=UPI0028A87C54|nr:hypothetical protein [Aeromicrobium sp.]
MNKPRWNNHYALVIAHRDDIIHVRAATGHYGAVVSALGTAGADFEVDLAPDDEEGPRCCGIRARVHDEYRLGDAGVIAAHLSGRGMLAFAYEPCFEPGADGPVWRYRHAGEHAVPARPVSLLFNIDYGFEDGSWYFGTPGTLALVARSALWRGLSVYSVGEPGAREALAVDSDAGVRKEIRDDLESLGAWVHEEDFGPADVSEGEPG